MFVSCHCWKLLLLILLFQVNTAMTMTTVATTSRASMMIMMWVVFIIILSSSNKHVVSIVPKFWNHLYFNNKNYHRTTTSKQYSNLHNGTNTISSRVGDDNDNNIDCDHQNMTLDHDSSITTNVSNTYDNNTQPPQRGKVLLPNFTAYDLYHIYQSVQHEYQNIAFHTNYSQQWKVLHHQQQQQSSDQHQNNNNITISILHHPTDVTCPYIKIEGIIPVSIQQCWNFLSIEQWDVNMPKMDPFYEGNTIIKEYILHEEEQHKQDNDDDTKTQKHMNHPIFRNFNKKKMTQCHSNIMKIILCRKRMKRILTFGKRDLVFVSCYPFIQNDVCNNHQTHTPTGSNETIISGTVSIEIPHLIPRKKGYTRAYQDSIAFYQPINNQTATKLTIVCRIDLNDSGANGTGGYIPMWLYVQTIGRTATISLQSMCRALLKEQNNNNDT